MRTVLLQPFTNILLRPEHHGPDQAGLGGAGVVYSIVVTGAVLRPSPPAGGAGERWKKR